MKQKDMALIAVIVIISAVISFFLSNVIFGSPSANPQQVEQVEAITSNFPKPDKNYFNASAYNPTAQITISDNNNSNPFNSTDQQQ